MQKVFRKSIRTKAEKGRQKQTGTCDMDGAGRGQGMTENKDSAITTLGRRQLAEAVKQKKYVQFICTPYRHFE